MDHGAPDRGGDEQDPLARLREAAAALTALDDPVSGSSDPAVHADRFEAVHDALASALADVDRG